MKLVRFGSKVVNLDLVVAFDLNPKRLPEEKLGEVMRLYFTGNTALMLFGNDAEQAHRYLEENTNQKIELEGE